MTPFMVTYNKKIYKNPIKKCKVRPFSKIFLQGGKSNAEKKIYREAK